MRRRLIATALLLGCSAVLANSNNKPKPDYTTPSPAMIAPERMTLQTNAREDLSKEKEYHSTRLLRGNPRKKEIALTFDDGPHRIYTLQLLNILQKYHAPATFFVVGRQVEKFPTLLQLEVIEGHEIGIHTYDHVDLTQIPPDMVGYELEACDRVIRKNIGSGVRFFRPPGGNYDNDVAREAAKRGYVMALWTDDPGDYGYLNRTVILQRTLDRLENGAIILLHDGMPETLAIMPQLITEIRKRGYTLVSMSQLAKDRE